METERGRKLFHVEESSSRDQHLLAKEASASMSISQSSGQERSAELDCRDN